MPEGMPKSHEPELDASSSKDTGNGEETARESRMEIMLENYRKQQTEKQKRMEIVTGNYKERLKENQERVDESLDRIGLQGSPTARYFLSEIRNANDEMAHTEMAEQMLGVRNPGLAHAYHEAVTREQELNAKNANQRAEGFFDDLNELRRIIRERRNEQE